jgi:regulatory protein
MRGLSAPPGDGAANRSPESDRPPKSLKARAVAYLARREYSRTELRDKLLATGATDGDIDAALDELAARGLLSDSRFAYAVVRQKAGAYSRRAIVETLKSKGVTGEAAAEAIAAQGIDDAAALVALWRQRFGRPPSDDREKARQVRFLQSRGFALSAVFKLMRNPPSDDDTGNSG